VRVVIRGAFLPYVDAEATKRFYRDSLRLVTREVERGDGRDRIVLSHPDGPGVQVVLEASPGAMRGDAGLTLVADNVDAVFESVLATGAEVVREPSGGPCGVRRCAFFDPAGNLVRIEGPRDPWD
jgi:predicted enzyme related to lactoylglutathione lyase